MSSPIDETVLINTVDRKVKLTRLSARISSVRRYRWKSYMETKKR
jgi:hypothetical protein